MARERVTNEDVGGDSPLERNSVPMHDKPCICRKRYKISCKIRPYTLQSNVTFARNSPLSLRAGTLAAHQMSRLMLLGSPPDMVHGV